MPEITRDEVAHLATLARIDLDDAELDHLAPQLSVILESVASISGVAGDDVPPTSHPLPLTNVFRDDVVRARPDRRGGAVGRARGRAAAVRRAADPGGRAVTRPDPAGPRPSWPTRWPPARPPRVELTQAHLDRIAAVDGAVHAFLHVDAEGALAQAAASDERRAAGTPARRARRRADRGQGRAGHPGPAHDLRLADPRGLGPAVRRHRGRPAARRPACRSSARPTWTSSRWAPRPSTRRTAPPTTRGTSTGSPAAPAAARRPRSPPSRRRSRSAPTPAARSASRARSPARSGVKPTYGGVSRYGLVALANSLDQAGPVTRTVLDAALLHEVIGGHDPLDSTSIDEPVPDARRRRPAGRERRPDRRPDRRGQASSAARATRPACWPGSRSRSSCWSRPAPRSSRCRCPSFVHALATYYLILPAEASSNLAKFDAMRYGLRVLPEGVEAPVGRGRHARDPRRRLRRRGEAPDHPRHLRAVQRLLRRLLRPGAEGAHADHRATSTPRSSRPTCWSRRPRRPPRSSSARRSTTRWRCTSTTSPPSRPTSSGVPGISVPERPRRRGRAAGRRPDPGAGARRRPGLPGRRRAGGAAARPVGRPAARPGTRRWTGGGRRA